MDSEAQTAGKSDSPGGSAVVGQQAMARGGVAGLIARQKSRLQNLSALIVLNFIIAGLGIITTVKLVRVMGKEGYGQLAYVLALGAYFAAIVSFGSDRALVKELIHSADRMSQALLASIVLRAGLLGCSVALLLVGRFSAGQWLALPWSGVFIVLAMSLDGMNIGPVYDVWGKMGWHAVIVLVERCIYVGVAWTAILSGRLSLGWIAAAYILAATTRLAIEFSWARSRVSFSGALEIGRHVKHLLGAGWLFWLASIAGLSCTNYPQIILRRYYGNEALGGYAACWRLVFFAVLVVNQLARVGRPASARATMPGVPLGRQVRFLLAYTGVMLAIAGTFSLPSIMFPRAILSWLFTAQYADAAPILRMLAIYVVFLVVGMVSSQYLISKGMQKSYFVSVIIGGGISVVVCWWMIPGHGGVGASMALLLGHGTAMFLYMAATVWTLVREARRQIIPPAVSPIEVDAQTLLDREIDK